MFKRQIFLEPDKNVVRFLGGESLHPANHPRTAMKVTYDSDGRPTTHFPPFKCPSFGWMDKTLGELGFGAKEGNALRNWEKASLL